MPKLLERPKERMLEAAREILEADGYDGLTMRKLASQCQISVGSVYSYFESKEDLAATILLDDFQEIKSSGINGILDLYHAVEQLNAKYHNIMTGETSQRLVQDISNEVKAMIKDDHMKKEPDLPDFMANAILLAGKNANMQYSTLETLFEKWTTRP